MQPLPPLDLGLHAVEMLVSFSSRDEPPGSLAAMVEQNLPGDVAEALALATRLARQGAVPGGGATRDLWEALATVASHDLGAARAIEPHLDAVAILGQSGIAEVEGLWGVFASEGGDDPLRASADTKLDGNRLDGTKLDGTKRWCSLADRLDAALVTASGRLWSVRLDQPGVTVLPSGWVARGLSEIPSGPVRFENADATPVGEPGWYLERPGFAWGGIGVAACWFGGAVGVARAVFAAAASRSDPFLTQHLGAIDVVIQDARRALAEASDLVDAGLATPVLAQRVRATVASTCDAVLLHAGRALGPAPLALDAEHAKRVADLQLYVRQHHAERDLAALGAELATGNAPW